MIFQESVIFKMTNVVCGSYNKSWVRINQCRLKAVGRNKIFFNFNATFIHPTNDIVVRYQLFKRENGYKPFLLKVEIDCCRFLSKPYDVIGVMVYRFYRDFSNVNHSCPLYGDIILKNMYLKIEELRRLPWPTGDYLMAMTWSFFRRPQFATNVSFQYVEDLL
ncbi:uncharacterized protein LOC108114144 [Drosophila eugracilis]|uniref:uncharacterized protein LOC108114144 n=1 Tax=Drosophila eugracilis TaxID=29029 RepID=UPI0007E5BDC3|nr:uncharacterized protein LOC108114144 [Drosophila eugracilis]